MIKALILMLLGVFTIFLVLFEMATLELASSTDWNTVATNSAGLILFIVVIGAALIIWRARN